MEPDLGKLRDLGRRVTGSVILPGAPEYETARRIHNLEIDRRPAAVLFCAMPDDVNRAVEFARAERIEVAIRGGDTTRQVSRYARAA